MSTLDYYKYAQLATAAYVRLGNSPWDGATFTELAASKEQQRLPLSIATDLFNPSDPDAMRWTVAYYYGGDRPGINDRSGFAATLFKNGVENVLAIRGVEASLFTEGGDVYHDLLGASIGGLGMIGVAVTQLVDLVNLIEQLYTPTEQRALQIRAELSTIRPADKVGQAILELKGELPAGPVSIPIPLYLVINTYDVAGKGALGSADKITLIGHSLGGHLAAAASMIFPERINAEVFAYNAPGFDPSTWNLVNLPLPRSFFALGVPISAVGAVIKGALADALGSGARQLDTGAQQKSASIINALQAFFGTPLSAPRPVVRNLESEDSLPGDDTSLVSSLLSGSTALGAEITVPTEVNSHSIEQIMDALAMHAVLYRLDNGLTLTTSKKYVDAAESNPAASEETLVEALHELLNPGSRLAPYGLQLPVSDASQGLDWWTGKGNIAARDAYHTAILEINKTLDELDLSATHIVSMMDDSAGPLTQQQLIDRADQGPDKYAYRYALETLLPFAVTGIDYSIHNASGELEPYIAGTQRSGTLTDQWIADRTQFLYFKNIAFRGDNDQVAAPGLDDQLFVDLAQSFRVYTTAVEGNGEAPSKPSDPTRIVFGGDQSDMVEGGDKADRLYGGAGRDLLAGGKGDDYVEGGSGWDIYQYNASEAGINSNDGNDTLLDTDGRGVLRYVYDAGSLVSSAVIHGVILDASIQSSDTEWRSVDGRFTYTPEAAGLKITILDAAGGSLLLEDWRDGDFGIHLGQRRITAPTNVIEGDQDPVNLNDILYGSNANAAYSWKGGEGNDFINAADYGDDVIEGGEGSDILEGSDGRDELFARQRAEIKAFMESSRTAPQIFARGDWLAGGLGDDLLVGSNAQDVLMGGGGKDILVSGGGDDFISGDDNFLPTTLWPPLIGSGVPEAFFNTPEFDWQIDFSNRFQVIFLSVAVFSSALQVGDADIIYAGAGDDSVAGLLGDDLIFGEEGNDYLRGDDGADTLLGGAGNDWLAGDGAGLLYPDGSRPIAGDDYLDGGAGDDVLLGEGGHDILIGGPGRDILRGGAGNDTYIFSRGDGVDFIEDTPSGSQDPEASEVVLPDILRSEVKFRLGSLMLDFGQGDAIHFEGFSPGDPDATPMIERIAFADGTSMTYRDVLAQGFDIDGTEGADSGTTGPLPMLVGTAVTDRIRGLGGNDMLVGLAGDDTLDGGPGADYLQGGAGDDRYVADLTDTIQDIEGHNSITLGPAVTPAELVARQLKLQGERFVILSLVGASEIALGLPEGLRLKGEVTQQNFDFVFADGTRLSQQELYDTAFTQSVSVQGGNGNDALTGYGGNDTVRGRSGDDTLRGGRGNDLLIGNDGSDVYLFDIGDGEDVIDDQGLVALGFPDTAGVDVIRFGMGISAQAVVLRRQANGDLIVRYGEGDELTVKGQYNVPGNAIERIELVDGSRIDFAGLTSLQIAPIEGTEGADVLVGTSADDTVSGLGGDDVIDGGAGDDRLEGGSGADAYLMYAGMGRDTIVDSSSTGEASALKLGPGYLFASLQAQRSGTDLSVSFRGTSDGVLLKDFYAAAGPEQRWQVLCDDGAPLDIETLIGMADPLADDAALAAREAYKQSLLTAWGVISIDSFPTHADVYSSWSQTTVTTYGNDPGDPPQVEMLDPVTFRSINGYGVAQGSTIIPPKLTFRSIEAQLSIRQSDDPVISMIGAASETLLNETHAVTLTGAPQDDRNISSSTFQSGTTVTNTVVTSTATGWVPIALDQPGRIDATLQVTRVTENRVLEQIDAGDSSNVIVGVVGGNGSHVALINAGGGDDGISAGTFDFVYGGEGNDRISGGRIVYGGDGDDSLFGANSDDVRNYLYGGAGNDHLYGGNAVLSGGEGDDELAGNAGATVFIIDPQERGNDSVADAGSASQSQIENWTYQSLGIAWPAENMQFGGRWSVIGDTGFALNYFYRRPNQYGELLGQYDLFYRDNDGYPFDARSIVYASLEELRAEFAALGITYKAQDIRYISALPVIPQVHADDYTALQPLYDAGIIEQDVVEFGPGVSLGNLTGLREQFADDAGVKDNALVLSWNGGHALRVALARHDDPIGTGIERYQFADGTFISTKDMLALATPVVLHQGPDNFTFAPGNGIQTLESHYTHIYFDVTISPDTISIGRSDVDLIISRNGSGDRLTLPDWYVDPTAVPSVSAQFYSGGSMLSADDLTRAGLRVHGTAADDILRALDGFANTLYGEGGNDILIGGEGDDYLEGGSGNNLLDGGAGNDFVSEFEGTNFVVGGPGDDWIAHYVNGGIIAFNSGDGNDAIYAAGDLTLSIGGGIAAADLALSQAGADLILTIGSNDTIRLSRQWEADPQAWPTITLQLFDSIHIYDFNAVIAAFRVRAASDPSLALSLHDILPDHQLSYSTNQALGGALAWQYARAGNLSALAESEMQAVLESPVFALVPQTISGGLDHAPELAHPIANQLASEGSAYAFTLPDDAFVDPDADDTLTIAATLDDESALPAWLAFDPFSRRFSGTPANEDVGTLGIRVTTSDDEGLSVSDEFVLTVANANDAPTAVADFASVKQGRTLSLTREALTGNDYDVDPTQDILSIVAVGNGVHGTESLHENQLIAFIADSGYFGSASFDYQLSDGNGGLAWATVSIEVTLNAAPVVEVPIADQYVAGGAAHTFMVPVPTFADADPDDRLAYSVALQDGGALPAWLAFDALALSFTSSPDIDVSGESIVRLSATDMAGAQVSDTFSIVVIPPNLSLYGTAGNDVLKAGAGADELFGLAGNDTLDAGAGQDVLDGGGGADTMMGGTGDDLYYVDNPGDRVGESSDQGNDTVLSSITFALGHDVEHLILVSDAKIDGTGNAQDNRIMGNGNANTLAGGAGDDYLDGGAGKDTLIGGPGNDTYVVDEAGDKIVENADEGIDSVVSAVNFTLGAHLENLVLTGSAMKGTGNALDNLLVGNAADNTLNAGAGSDILQGLGGDDDLKNTSGSTLFDGGAGDDTLAGGGSRELFIGGAGNDTIVTGKAADIIAFNAGDGQDLVKPSSATDNTISLGGGIRYEELTFSKWHHDLVLHTGGSDQMTLKDWYAHKSSVRNLQVVAEAMPGVDPHGAGPLRENKVERFDFGVLTHRFDLARAADPILTQWSLSNALLDAHLTGSDTEAIGGDLAYRYGLNGALTGIGLAPAQDVLKATGFGREAQQLRPLQDLQQGQIRLS